MQAIGITRYAAAAQTGRWWRRVVGYEERLLHSYGTSL
jgi:hypothetical protein